MNAGLFFPVILVNKEHQQTQDQRTFTKKNKSKIRKSKNQATSEKNIRQFKETASKKESSKIKQTGRTKTIRTFKENNEKQTTGPQVFCVGTLSVPGEDDRPEDEAIEQLAPLASPKGMERVRAVARNQL